MQNQRWLSWLLLLVMGYMVYSASGSRGPVSPSVQVPTGVTTQEAYPALTEATDVERWKRKLNPDYASVMNCTIDSDAPKEGLAFRAVEDKLGEGEQEAACGDTITVQLTVWSAGGTKGFSEKVTLALGSRQIAAGLDYGLLGMKAGGVRTLILPPSALVRSKAAKGFEAARKALPADKLAVVTVERLAH